VTLCPAIMIWKFGCPKTGKGFALKLGQTWRVVFDAHCSNGGRMNTEFSTACKELGFDVRPSANGGYVFGKVKK